MGIGGGGARPRGIRGLRQENPRDRIVSRQKAVVHRHREHQPGDQVAVPFFTQLETGVAAGATIGPGGDAQQLGIDAASSRHIVLLLELDAFLAVPRGRHIGHGDPDIAQAVLVQVHALLEVAVRRHMVEPADQVAVPALIHVDPVVEVLRRERPVGDERGVAQGELRVAGRPLVELQAIGPVAGESGPRMEASRGVSPFSEQAAARMARPTRYRGLRLTDSLLWWVKPGAAAQGQVAQGQVAQGHVRQTQAYRHSVTASSPSGNGRA